MVPTGYEYTYLTDKKISRVLSKLLESIEPLWPEVFVMVGPIWEMFEFRDWLSEREERNLDCDLYLSSHKEGFDYIEEYGIVPNSNGYQYFMLNFQQQSPVAYQSEILGNPDSDNTNFGEFKCEIYAKSMNLLTVITPKAENESDIIKLVKGILND